MGEQYLDDLGSIPAAWNKSNEIYQFRYIVNDEQKQNDNDKQQKHKQTILIKIISMDESELLINGIKEGSNKLHSLEIALSDHIHLENASNHSKNTKQSTK